MPPPPLPKHQRSARHINTGISGSQWDIEAVRRDPAAIMRTIEGAKHKGDKGLSSKKASTAMEESRSENPSKNAKYVRVRSGPLAPLLEGSPQAKSAKSPTLQNAALTPLDGFEKLSPARPQPSTINLFPATASQALSVALPTLGEEALTAPASLGKHTPTLPDCYDSFGEACADLGIPGNVISPRRYLPRPTSSPAKNWVQKRNTVQVEEIEPTRNDLDTTVGDEYGDDHQIQIQKVGPDHRTAAQKAWDEHTGFIIAIWILSFIFLLVTCYVYGGWLERPRKEDRHRLRKMRAMEEAHERRAGERNI